MKNTERENSIILHKPAVECAVRDFAFIQIFSLGALALKLFLHQAIAERVNPFNTK